MMWPCTRHTTFVKNLTVQTRNLDSRLTVEGPVLAQFHTGMSHAITDFPL